MKDDPLVDQSLHFAGRIVKLHRCMTKEKKETAETEYWLRLLVSSVNTAKEKEDA